MVAVGWSHRVSQAALIRGADTGVADGGHWGADRAVSTERRHEKVVPAPKERARGAPMPGPSLHDVCAAARRLRATPLLGARLDRPAGPPTGPAPARGSSASKAAGCVLRLGGCARPRTSAPPARSAPPRRPRGRLAGRGFGFGPRRRARSASRGSARAFLKKCHPNSGRMYNCIM